MTASQGTGTMSGLMMHCFKKYSRRLIAAFLLLPASCGHRSHTPPVISSDSFKDSRKCDIPFVSGARRFVHAIEGELPNKRNISAIGITAVSPEIQTIRCVMMTIEGFVLFEALYDGKLTINRGIPPFDSESFAKGMMDDIRMIFFKPDGTLTQSGLSDSGEYICRYRDKKNGIADVTTDQNREWEIRLYDEYSKLTRSVKAFMDQNAPISDQITIPNRMELRAYGDKPYTLKLNLIRTEDF